MPFLERVMTREKHSQDIRERAIGSEVPRVRDRIAMIPGGDLFLNDFTNCRLLGRTLGKEHG